MSFKNYFNYFNKKEKINKINNIDSQDDNSNNIEPDNINIIVDTNFKSTITSSTNSDEMKRIFLLEEKINIMDELIKNMFLYFQDEKEKTTIMNDKLINIDNIIKNIDNNIKSINEKYENNIKNINDNIKKINDNILDKINNKITELDEKILDLDNKIKNITNIKKLENKINEIELKIKEQQFDINVNKMTISSMENNKTNDPSNSNKTLNIAEYVKSYNMIRKNASCPYYKILSQDLFKK